MDFGIGLKQEEKMNLVILSGRLTQVPEIQESKNGTSYLWNAVAVRGRDKDDTTFVNITVFGKTAEFVEEYLDKGCRVVISGRLSVNDKGYTNVVVNSVEPIDWATDNEEDEEDEYDEEEYEDDDDEWEYEDEDDEWEEEEE